MSDHMNLGLDRDRGGQSHRQRHCMPAIEHIQHIDQRTGTHLSYAFGRDEVTGVAGVDAGAAFWGEATAA